MKYYLIPCLLEAKEHLIYSENSKVADEYEMSTLRNQIVGKT